MPDFHLTDSIVIHLTPTTNKTISSFESSWALFLDVDGTLVDFVEQPDQLRADAGLVGILRGLYRWNEGALALVSGRTIASVDAIIEPLRLPVAGLHGYERRDAAGRVFRETLPERQLSTVRQRFQKLVALFPGTFVEEKGPAIALHYRRAPSAAADVEKLASALEGRLPEPMCVQRGKMVLEIRSCDHSKGSAIEAFMDEPPFRDRTAVFLGDDTTDEYGFRWVNEHGGLSVKVGAGESTARFRMESVDRVLHWLEAYVRFLRQEAEHVS